MVKSVVGDESNLKSFEDRLFDSTSSVPSQVGLVIGKLSQDSDRGLVYAVVPTPPTESGGPACALVGGGGEREERRRGGAKRGKGGGAGVSEAVPLLQFDAEWITEHARQVSRMLLGGMSVVGIYIWSSEALFKATPPATISQVIKAVSQAAPLYDTGFDERLLIHISYSPRRLTCRICDLTSGSLRPCDFKYSKLSSALQMFRCTYNFKLRLTILQADPFKKVVSKAISHIAKEIQSAKVLIDGDLLSNDMQINSEGIHKVELLLPYKEEVPSEESSYGEVAGLLLFTGFVSASAYLAPRESVSEAISDLKVDIITSLRSRLDIILDEAEGEEALTAEVLDSNQEDAAGQKATHEVVFHELREPYSLSFPRRVFIPWSPGIFLSDYLQPSETIEDAMDRCTEVIPIEETPVEASTILEPENVGTPTQLTSFWDAVRGVSAPMDLAPAGKESKQEDSFEESSPIQRESDTRNRGNFKVAAAIFVLLVALLLGFVFNFSGVPLNSSA